MVEVLIKTLKTEIEIVAKPNENFVAVNGLNVKYDANCFIEEIKSIVSSWKLKMVNPRIIDGEWYKVKISNGESETVYVGRNSFPPNYNNFKNLINKIKSLLN